MSKILELISVQETAVTRRLLQLEQGVAELKMGGGQRREDASQHYLGFMEVKLGNTMLFLQSVYNRNDLT